MKKKLIVTPDIKCEPVEACCDYCGEETRCARSPRPSVITSEQFIYDGAAYSWRDCVYAYPIFGRTFEKIRKGAERFDAWKKLEKAETRTIEIDICKTCAAQIAKQL